MNELPMNERWPMNGCSSGGYSRSVFVLAVLIGGPSVIIMVNLAQANFCHGWAASLSGRVGG